jgi:hypothetical protein
MVAPTITALNLEFCNELTDEDLAPVRNLSALNLNALHRVSGDGVVSVARACGKSLAALELYWQHALPNDALIEVAKACPGLTALNLSGCQRFEDSGARALARSCGGLRDLNLTRCPLLTDEGLAFICHRLPHLRDVNLYADSQFTDAGLRTLAKLPALTAVDLCGLGKISADVRAPTPCAPALSLGRT